MPKKRQDARSATPAPKATPESTSSVEGPPASKKGPQTSAPVYLWQPWTEPSPDELRRAFDNLVGGGRQKMPLKVSLEGIFASGVNPETGHTYGELGRFLSAEDWQIIVWAVYAWFHVWKPMSSEDDSTYDTSTPFKAVIRATKVWNQ